MGIKLINESDLKNVADAIREKSGTDSSLTFPNDFVDAIENISTGGSSAASAKGVNFRDYDGTVVASYTANEFTELVALPPNPDHTSEGLTAQGWNWSLVDAKAYVAKYGCLEIGQMYITTDGKTHVHIHLEKGRTSPMLGVCPNGTVDVDWGDGTAHDTLTGTSATEVKWTSNHNYASPGDYVIKLTVTGSMGFYGNSSSNQYSALLRYSDIADGRNTSYQSSILNVNIGDSVTSISNSAFHYCNSISSITIPNNVTSISNSAFQYCYSLSSITIPNNVTSIGSSAFQYCYSLSSITIPDSVISISNSAFASCYSLSSITIPNRVTSISTTMFQYCFSLSSITIPDSVTSIGSTVFQNCYSLSSIIIPDSVTSIGGTVFQYCYSLSSIIIPDNVTSIGGSTFYNCYSLSSIIIPDSVTSIGGSAFYGCTGVAELHFKNTTPPTLANSVAFTGIPADCIIYVPYSEDHSILEAYKTATNWSTYAARIQEEPQ